MKTFGKPVSLAIVTLALGIGACSDGGGGSRPVNTTVIDAPQFGQVVNMAPGYDTVSVAWPSDNATLRGTLYLPNAQGPHPAIILHFGSTKWTRSDIGRAITEPWLLNGIAVLIYDKRGAGASGGRCCPFTDAGYFPLLATDLIEGVEALKMYSDIDPLRIGLYGFSQGGWVVPNATARSPSVAFSIVGSGPTVSLDEELLYSRITGDNNCKRSNLSEAEIDTQMAAASPGGFDPRSDLEMYTVPGFWFYGSRDTSVPVRQSVAILDEIESRLAKDFTHITFPGANHSLVTDGAICQTSGRNVDFFTPIFKWLNPILFGP